jgi:putative oxidoreductase
MSTSAVTVNANLPMARTWPWTDVLRTDASVWQAILRLTLAGVMLPHAGQHVLGVFGGYGFNATLQWMTGTLGFPAPLAATALVVEGVAPIALIVGFGSRAAGLLLALLMATAATTHVANGFFMNWAAALPAGSEGFEYHLLAIAVAMTVVVRGGGSFSADRLLSDPVRSVAPTPD